MTNGCNGLVNGDAIIFEEVGEFDGVNGLAGAAAVEQLLDVVAVEP